MRNTTGKILGSVFALTIALVMTVGLTSPADAAVQYTTNMAFSADSSIENPNNYDGGTDDGYNDNTTGVYGNGYWNLGDSIREEVEEGTYTGDEKTASGLEWSGLQDSAENNTGLSVHFAPDTSTVNEANEDLGLDDPEAALWQSYINLSNWDAGTRSGDFTISGLDAGQEVNLLLYSGWGNDQRRTQFTFDGTSKVADESQTDASWTEEFIEGNNYVKFEGITADGSGDILFSIEEAQSGDYPHINGFQMEVIPEPSSFALLLLGSLALFHRRRRRNS